MKNVKVQLCLWSVLLIVGLATVSARGDLVGYWSFENSANIGEDSSGQSNELTPIGDAAYADDSTRGGVLQLDGDGDYLTSATFPTGVPTGLDANYTMAMWFKYAGGSISGGGDFLIGWGTGYVAYQTTALSLYPSNGLYSMWYGSGTAFVQNISGSTAVLYDGDWHHVALTYDGNARRLYLNGELVGTKELSGGSPTANNFSIGHTLVGSAIADYDGFLDDVVICDTVLSQSEIQDVMNGNIPEPATMVIMMAGGILTVFRKRTKS